MRTLCVVAILCASSAQLWAEEPNPPVDPPRTAPQEDTKTPPATNNTDPQKTGSTTTARQPVIPDNGAPLGTPEAARQAKASENKAPAENAKPK